MQFCLNNTTQCVCMYILRNAVNHDMSNPNMNKTGIVHVQIYTHLPNPISNLFTVTSHFLKTSQI